MSPIYSACKSSNHKLFKNHKINPDTNRHKTKKYTNIKHKFSKNFLLPLLKKHIRLGHAGIMDHAIDLSIPDFIKVKKRNVQKQLKNYTNA